MWPRPEARTEVSVDSSPESHHVPHPPGMTLKWLPGVKSDHLPIWNARPWFFTLPFCPPECVCFLNQGHVSDCLCSNLTTAFFRILVPSSLAGTRCVLGACEKERGPEWVSSENRTPAITHLPFKATPFWGWLGGGGTKPKVGRRCIWSVSLVMLRSPSDPWVGTSPPSFSFTLHEAGKWTQGHPLVSAKGLCQRSLS